MYGGATPFTLFTAGEHDCFATTLATGVTRVKMRRSLRQMAEKAIRESYIRLALRRCPLSLGRTTMKLVSFVSLIAICAVTSAAARADDGASVNRYVVTNLTSDVSGATNTDPVLQNAWGVAF
jgi:hypothetical protein